LAKFAIPFHILAICSRSRSNATSRCEYFFHRCDRVIQCLSTLELTVPRHFCSILKHGYNANASAADACRCNFQLPRTRQPATPASDGAGSRGQSVWFLPVRLTTIR
jgi:hypothetical protein